MKVTELYNFSGSSLKIVPSNKEFNILNSVGGEQPFQALQILGIKNIVSTSKIKLYFINKLFSISLSPNSLPIAHTCFFSIDLPNYTSYEILKQKLLYAMNNSFIITDGSSLELDL